MLSFKNEGTKVAKVKGGIHDKKFIYLHEQMDSNPLKYLSKDFFKKHKSIKKSNILKLQNAIKLKQEPEDDSGELKDIYYEAIEDINKTIKNGIRITDGKLIPIPKKNIVEKIYVSAPSGAGKSTWCGNWLAEFKKMFKDDDIFVFSTIDYDKVLDKHDPIRISLDEELLEDPISPEEIMNSCCVFDDVDTITNPQIRNNICGLRDFLLEQGRHFEIRMLMTSHLLLNYKSTRRMLNEATTVCFFPRAGSTYHIKTYLTKYVGLEKNQIKKILNLPSRWVALYRSYPMYVLYEKGIYLLN